ncbi:MAG: DNA polymerase I [Desulfovibrionaceae bacterium]|jgi:DNA polymerase-1|nr:DNA polymerase I [Desulfovibrionaceae bacterium]
MPLTDRLGLSAPPVFLMDGTAFVFRSFYAYRDMTRSDGAPSNALYTVMRMLLKILREERPTHFVFFMDGKGPNFRHELYPEYKANRSATPEELVAQLAPIRQGVELLGVPVTVSEGCEADDCIASLAARLKRERPVVIVGADKDLKQCLDANVFLWDPGTKTDRLTTMEDFRAETGLSPAQWADFQAVIGDSSDNIPGVPGVGPKTAAKIFEKYPDLEAIRDHLDDGEMFSAKQREKFQEHMDAVFTYRRLTTLDTGRCAELGLDELALRTPDPAKMEEFLQTWEFRTLLREAGALLRAMGATGAAGATGATGTGDKARNVPLPAAGTGGGIGGIGGTGGTKGGAKGGGKNAQLSLFDAPAATAAVSATAAAAIADLGDLAGRDVGLHVADGRVRLGLGSAGTTDSPDAGSQNTNDAATEWDLGARATGAGAAELAGALGAARRVACADVKALLRTDAAWSAVPVERWFDLGLAAYLINPEDRDYSWQRLADRFAAELETAPENPGLLALRMAGALEKTLGAAHLTELMRTLETPLIPVLARMEARGIAIDRAAFATFLADVQGQLDALTRRVYEAAERQFNLRSSQQLAEVLFDHLGLKASSKTPGGARSTSQAALEKLDGQHPVVALILEYRTLEKLRSTYLEPLPGLADAAGRIHTSFNQLATATGRLSSSNPNLQNIPIRGSFGMRMRSCFTAPAGRRLVAADYSQIELRVLAHMSGDPALVDAFRHGLDIHSRTAGILFDKEPDAVSADERRNAKTINFGLIYGMGPQKLAQELKISLKEAKEFIERYFERLATLKAFYEGVEQRARTDGYVTTIAGRRRLLPGIHSANNQMQALARRQAVNTLIQGSAADIIKLAMLAADADETLAGLDAQCILQVHDELLLETPEGAAQAAGERLAEIMASVSELSVPLKVDWGTGATWAEAH